MHIKRTLSLFLLALLLAPVAARAQSTGNCAPAIGEAYLDINNVRARVLNNGNLFWRGSPAVYEVPQGGGESAIFASGIWLGGLVDGQLRTSASTYGPYEFWTGPLDDAGNPPADCSEYDRIWKVSREDVIAYDGSGTATPDLSTWPTGLGAPTLDANGDTINVLDLPFEQRRDRTINLAAGERPAILGDQMLWWIMNDRGNTHTRTGRPPIGLEVHASAFAFNTSGAIGNTTFYKYRMFYKGAQPLQQAYMGIFSDPDLGNAFDDYVGSDTTLGLGYVYNADDDDEGHYGSAPPATGYDFFQGPLVDDDGRDNDGDGEVDEAGERLKMTSFVYYNNGGGVQGDPDDGQDFYNYMQGLWLDGQPITLGGDGRGFSETPTSFMFPGDPVSRSYWTEINSDGNQTAIAPADRRFVMSTGPFTINPGDEQEIVFGIIWSRGDDYLDSVAKLREDDALAQAVFDINFQLPAPPASPRVDVTELDRQVLLEWGYNPTDNNYLSSYTATDILLSDDVADRDYVFEGYEVYQYESPQDQTGTRLATYDVENGITRVIEGEQLTFVTAEGTDAGVRTFHVVDGLTNYQTYYFGVAAYAYNAESGQKVYRGPVARIEAIPAPSRTIIDTEALDYAFGVGPGFELPGQEGNFDVIADPTEVISEGQIALDVVNPAKITGHDYQVRFYNVALPHEDGLAPDDASEVDAAPLGGRRTAAQKRDHIEVLTYDIVDMTTGEVVFDGETAALALRDTPPFGRNAVTFDGLSLSIFGPPNEFKNFLAVANAAGPLDPPEMGAFAFNANGFPFYEGSDRPAARQQATGDGLWGIHTADDNGSRSTYEQFLSRTSDGGALWDRIIPYDFEIRFTERGSKAVDPFASGSYFDVPFELWRTGIATPDDPSDDVRMIPYVLDSDLTSLYQWTDEEIPAFNLFTEQTLDSAAVVLGGAYNAADHSVSGAANDPYTDWIYWHMPTDDEPGESGYNAWVESVEAAIAAGGNPYDVYVDNDYPVLRRTVLVNWNGGAVDSTWSSYDQQLPETGTVIRIITNKTIQPNDVFSFSTDGLGAREMTTEEREQGLENMGIVPNPYRGSSVYEVSQLTDEVRFTGLPDVPGTIRVFTLNGTLVRTLEFSGATPELAWNLLTEDTLPVASGMYLVHVEVPNVGERVLKFGVVKKRTQLNTY